MNTITLTPDMIPIGKEHAISKQELCRRLGLNFESSERTVRKMVEKLRESDDGSDFVIVSSSHFRGYFRSNDINDIRAFYKETTWRGKNTFKPMKKTRRLLVKTLKENGMAVPSKEAAEYLGISIRTLARWIEDGKLEPLKDGKENIFDRKDLEKLRGI